MPGTMPTLHELCLQRIARLLKDSYWNPELPLKRNPFCRLPPILVDTLINHVTRISTSEEPLLSSDLRLLLTSGRVREFVLDDEGDEDDEELEGKFANEENITKILMDLSCSCRGLNSLKLNLWLTDRDAIHHLLSEARNIKYVESHLSFDLLSLCNSEKLETLFLHFWPKKNELCDFLKVNGQLRYRTSLKHLEVELSHTISTSDIANVLKYCTELISINCDILESLEHLHAEELESGALTCTYKIQKCCLGDGSNVSASSDGIRLASLTCPYLRDVNIFIEGDADISCLSNCPNLTTLVISGKRIGGRNSVRLRSHSARPTVYSNLKHLELRFVTNVDFHSIGVCCPNLEELKLRYREHARPDYSRTSFRKLLILHLFEGYGHSSARDTLVGILSSATNLRDLTIRHAGKLRDAVLEDILKENSLHRLKNLRLDKCGLTSHGWRRLVSSSTALENLWVHRPVSRGIESVLRESKPGIKVTSGYF